MAEQHGAAAVIYKSQLHNPFDWDGSKQSALLPAAFVEDQVYDCLGFGSAAATNGTIDILDAQPTPIEGGAFFALNIIFAGLLALLCAGLICFGIWQVRRLYVHSMEGISIRTVAYEATSLTFLFVRFMNGPQCAPPAPPARDTARAPRAHATV